MADVDIYVGGRPQDLKGSAPEIYEDYAVRSASEIFIQDDLHTLLFKPEFIAARDAAFSGRSPEFIDIRVSPRGGVFVRAPGSPDWLDTQYNPTDTHVKAIAAKTQRAYQELQRSRESSPASSVESSPRPLRDRHVVHERSFPYPEVRGELDSLRRENHELRHRLQHLEEHSHLDRSDALLRDVSEQLRENQEANRALLEEIGSLRQEARRGQHDTQQSLACCLELLARLEEQSRLSPAQLEELGRLREDNGRLQEELRGAREDTRAALEARDGFERQLVAAREELGRLEPENADLNRALREVEEAIGGRRESRETNPAAIRRFIATMDEHQERLGEQAVELRTLCSQAEEYVQTIERQQRELEQLRRDNSRLGEELGGAREDTRVAIEARDQFEKELAEARETLERLGEENADLKRALQEVDEAIGERREPTETNPATIRRFITTIDALTEYVEEQARGLDGLSQAAHQFEAALLQQQEALEAVGRTLGRGALSIEELPGAVASMKADLEGEIQRVSDAKRAVEAREQALLEELGRLRPENRRLEEELAAIKEAVRSGRVDEESIPETISRLIGELGEQGQALQEATAAHQAAMKQQQRALTAVGRALSREISSIEELPGAVSKALQQAKEREAVLTQRTLQAEAELSGERSLVVDEQQRSEALRRDLASMRQELVQAREEIEALKGAARKVAEQHQAEVEGLGRELEEKGRQLTAQKKATRKLSDQLDAATSELEAERRKSGAQELEIRRLGGSVFLLEGQVAQAGEREKALRAELDSARETISDQTSAAEDQQRSLEEKEREFRAAEAENRELTEQLRQARSDLEDATREHQVASEAQKKKIASLSDQVEDLTRKLQAATSTGEDLQEQLDAVSAEKREAERQVRALKAQLEEQTGEIAHLTRRVESRDATIERQRREISQARETLADEAIRRSQMERAHSEEVIPLRAKVQELTEELAEAEERGRAVGTTNADLLKQLEEARRELEQARLQHGSDERINLEMAEELERMTTEKVRLEQLLGAIDQLERENHLLTAGTKSLADELAELDTTGPAFANLPKDIRHLVETLKSQIAELKEEQRALDELERTIRVLRADLEVQTEATTREHQTVERLQQTLREHEADFEKLEASHRAKRSQQSEVLKRLRTTISTEREEAASQLALKDEDIRELEGEKRELERTVAKQAATLRDNEVRLAALKKSYDYVDGRNEELQEKIRILKGHNRDLGQAIQKLEEQRDSFQESEIYWEGKFQETRRALVALRKELAEVRTALQYAEQACEALRSENRDLYALLREHLGEGIYTPRDVESAFHHLKERHVCQLAQKDLLVAERQEEVERLLERVRKTEAKRLKMQDERDAAREDVSRTTADLLQARRESRQLRDDLSSVSERRDHLQHALERAHEQIGSQAKVISGNVEDMRRLREHNRALEEDLESAHSSLAKESRRIEELTAKHEEELRQARETEERRRIEELSELERQHANARDTTELMSEIVTDIGSTATLEELFPNERLRRYIKSYLEAMRDGKLQDRYQTPINREISALDQKPGPLSDLKFFTPFFGITDQISQIKSSKLFFRLQANKSLLKSLDPQADRDMIAQIKKQNKEITTRLLKFFFQKIQDATKSGPCSRFENLGNHLWIWDTIFHGLDSRFYVHGSSTKGFKSSSDGVNLANAESMRKTVHALHTRFQQMMAPLIPLLKD